MKILLIQPAKSPLSIGGEDFFIYEPLALEYIASVVANSHEVKILDMRIDKDLEKVIADFKPAVVGITSYTVHVNTVKALADKIKNLNPEIFIVIGGHHATVMPEDFFVPSVDLVVMGEGVFVFRNLIARLEGGKDFDGIPGLAYMKDNKQVIVPPESFTDLDIFPFPLRSLTEEYRKYYFSEWMRPLASIRTSKGCPFRCNFCALWKLTGGKYLKRKPELIVKELAQIKEEFVFFSDDESLVDARRMKELARIIKDSGIKKRYFLYGRSDTIVNNPDLIKTWREIGLERVFVGLEFFRDEDLKYIKKGSTVENNKRAINILHDNNIEIYASFIVRPEFKKEDFIEFAAYCRSLNLNFPSFAVLTPLPGTDFYEEVKDRLITHNYDLFDFIHTILPTSMPLEEFYRMLAYLYENSKSPWKSLSFLLKYKVCEIPSLFKLLAQFKRRLTTASSDYS
ncbi:MAG: radical SAM protein [Candidatus Eremiobacterota bacterium]